MKEEEDEARFHAGFPPTMVHHYHRFPQWGTLSPSRGVGGSIHHTAGTIILVIHLRGTAERISTTPVVGSNKIGIKRQQKDPERPLKIMLRTFLIMFFYREL